MCIDDDGFLAFVFQKMNSVLKPLCVFKAFFWRQLSINGFWVWANCAFILYNFYAENSKIMVISILGFQDIWGAYLLFLKILMSVHAIYYGNVFTC